jgi:hypothetical protein
MNYSSGIDYLTSNIDQEIDKLKDHIALGKLVFDEYKRLCGVLQGLEQAREIITEYDKREEEKA